MAVTHEDHAPTAFVWSVGLAMVLVVVVFLVKYGRIIPITEDWLCVPALTGNEPHVLRWLWEQTNEHRTPLPKLVLLLLLKGSDGDFRTGMIFDILLITALAVAMILVARHLRDGYTRYVDAFFPIALLHLGHAENLFWGWQMTVVMPTIAACVVLLVLIGDPDLSKPIPVVLAAMSLVSLPLSGLNGIIYTPILAVWLGYRGCVRYLAADKQREVRWIDVLLPISSLLAVGLTGLYFVGYQRPAWAPSPQGVIAWLDAAFKFLALGFGPTAGSSWVVSEAAALAFFLSGIFLAAWAIRRRPSERLRAGGLLVFLSAVGVFTLGVGWGRASAIAIFGKWPLRYSLFAVPALCASFYAWELYGPRRVRHAVQASLLIIMCVLLPLNTVRGLSWMNWFHDRDDELRRDLVSGASALELAERYRPLLHHSMEVHQLADYIRMLHQGGYEPFVHMATGRTGEPNRSVGTSPPAPESQTARTTISAPWVIQEIRYTMPEAAMVYLVWGVDGWSIAPAELRPSGTELRPAGPKNVPLMHTAMVRDGNMFSVKLAVPVGTTVDYGFLITKSRGVFDIDGPVWAGGYQVRPTNHGVVEIRPALVERLAVLDLFRDASEVLARAWYFAAGISMFLAGWLGLFFLRPLLGRSR